MSPSSAKGSSTVKRCPGCRLSNWSALRSSCAADCAGPGCRFLSPKLRAAFSSLTICMCQAQLSVVHLHLEQGNPALPTQKNIEMVCKPVYYMDKHMHTLQLRSWDLNGHHTQCDSAVGRTMPTGFRTWEKAGVQLFKPLLLWLSICFLADGRKSPAHCDCSLIMASVERVILSCSVALSTARIRGLFVVAWRPFLLWQISKSTTFMPP